MGHMGNVETGGKGVQGIWGTWPMRLTQGVWATLIGHMANGAHG